MSNKTIKASDDIIGFYNNVVYPTYTTNEELYNLLVKITTENYTNTLKLLETLVKPVKSVTTYSKAVINKRKK